MGGELDMRSMTPDKCGERGRGQTLAFPAMALQQKPGSSGERTCEWPRHR